MIDKLHGCYKDTSDSEQCAAICICGMVWLLAVTGILVLVTAALEMLG